ncbi:MAG: hypothetical protein IKX21_05075 [Deltaproteobacteria bacterium]|nr:hypothetical protein [Deltaproteobacteria bacterium]
MTRSCAFVGLFFCLMVLMTVSPVLAHRVHLYAFVEGGEIVADCRFSKKSPAQNARVEVLDAASGKLLVSGESDARGAAQLSIPPELAAHPADVLVVLNAGEGHRAEWRIDAVDLRRGLAGTPSAISSPVRPEPSEAAKQGAGMAVQVSGTSRCISPEELEARLREERARFEAERNAEGPGLTEIVGGIGWIAGIFSALFALNNRRRKRS